jgi:hypothetical protein
MDKSLIPQATCEERVTDDANRFEIHFAAGARMETESENEENLKHMPRDHRDKLDITSREWTVQFTTCSARTEQSIPHDP